MKKHANKFILTGLIISGIGLLWYLVIYILGLIISSYWEEYSFIIPITMIFTMIYIWAFIVSFTKIHKGYKPGAFAMISVILASAGLVNIFYSFISDMVFFFSRILPLTKLPFYYSFNFATGSYILEGSWFQLIGYILLLFGFIGWFRKVRTKDLIVDTSQTPHTGDIPQTNPEHFPQ